MPTLWTSSTSRRTLASRADADAIARLSQRERGGSADSFGGTSDEGDLVWERHL